MNEILKIAENKKSINSENIEMLKLEIKELDKCGFVSASAEKKALLAEKLGFLRITSQMIIEYLQMKSKINVFKDEQIFDSGYTTNRRNPWRSIGIYRDYLHAKVGIKWQERSISEVRVVPPQRVLDRFKFTKELNLFTNFWVASTDKRIFIESLNRDPLLLGEIFPLNDRFFIAQWGNDIPLDDVI